jgi:hypothetical protein
MARQIGGRHRQWLVGALLCALAGPLLAQSGDPTGIAPTAASSPDTVLATEPPEAIAPLLPVEIPFAAADAAAVHEPSAADAWGGPRRGDEATLSDRVVSYAIEASLDPKAHRIDGKQQLTWRNRSNQPVGAVFLHLYLNAFEGPGSTFFTEQRERDFGFRSEVPVADGEWGHIDLTRVQQGGVAVPWSFVHPDGGPASDRTVVRLDLPEVVAPGASTTLDIAFVSQLPRVVARTGYFGSFHLAGQWFPKIGVLELPGERGATAPRWNVHEFHLNSEFYADFGTFDVTLTVPQDYRIGATGALQGEPRVADGKATWHFVQGDVIDFAWTADNRFAEPLVGTYEGTGSPKVKVQVLYPPEYASNAAPVLQATLDSLAYFSRTLGPYPYDTVTAVIPPFNADEASGMEYPTFFTAESHADVTPGTLSSYLLDFVTIHEFGHGYFMGLLASNEFEEPMLDEGLNEYWNSRMLRERGAPQPLATRWMRALGIAPGVAQFEAERLGAKLREPADGVGANSWLRMSSGSYGSVYARTTTVMRDLEAQLGSNAIERAFKAYYARWKFRHPSIADLRESLADATGARTMVERVFAQQVYATGKVDDRIADFASEEVLPQPGTDLRDGRHVEVTSDDVEQQIADTRKTWAKANPKPAKGTGPYPFLTRVLISRQGVAVPQTVKVRFADGSSEVVHFDGEQRWQRFAWVKPVQAVSVELDPDQRHYLDASKADDSRSLNAEPSAARRWSSDVAAVLQNLYALLVNL